MSKATDATDVTDWACASDIRTKMSRILIEDFNVRPEQLYPAARLDDDLGLDSLAFLDFSAMLEDRLGITLSQEVLGVARTLQDLMDLVEAAYRKRAITRILSSYKNQ